MCRSYKYLLQYKDNDVVVKDYIKDCIPYISDLSGHNFITKDVLYDYLNRPKKRHKVLFENWVIKREPHI